MPVTALQQQLLPTLKKYFGYDSFRKNQEEIIKSVLNQEDVLVIMPTGGGKSICYQLPALLLDGVCIVISPLIALMKDQVDGLKANGVKAEFYNSSQTYEEQDAILNSLAKKELDLLYVAPESLGGLNNILNSNYVSCIAIDEAHCISSWGHDFRPSYQQLGFLKKSLPQVPIIALTATADKATRHDIVKQLNIPHAKQFISSFDRKNIFLEVRPAANRVKQIVHFIENREQESGIIYCLSRKGTEKLAEKLQNKGFSATAYHAGLSFEERNQVQEDFIFDKVKIVCATVAFGMGIDKSNVRFVIHYNLPKNLEGYYQEIGRAGRDGLPSKALLFHTYADVVQLRRFTEGAVNEELQNAKLDRIKEFADATDCRRKILLSYFGEFLPENCGHCDVCKNPPEFFDGTILAQKILSCIARLRESESTNTVIDVLRGARNQEILNKNYPSLKTYGIGKDVSWRDWQHYITQLINQGYCEIAFHEKNALKLTPYAKEVLFRKQKVQLTKPQDIASKKAQSSKQSVSKTTSTLFEQLRKLRYRLSQEENIPAYQIFSDATLKEIERERPQSESEFLAISGVGEYKMQNYGSIFIAEIQKFNRAKNDKKATTYQKTYKLLQEGKTIKEIAKTRDLNEGTIYSHLGHLYKKGKPIDILQFISEKQIEKVRAAKKEIKEDTALKPYFEFFEEKIDYAVIRLCLAYLEKENA